MNKTLKLLLTIAACLTILIGLIYQVSSFNLVAIALLVFAGLLLVAKVRAFIGEKVNIPGIVFKLGIIGLTIAGYSYQTEEQRKEISENVKKADKERAQKAKLEAFKKEEALKKEVRAKEIEKSAKGVRREWADSLMKALKGKVFDSYDGGDFNDKLILKTTLYISKDLEEFKRSSDFEMFKNEYKNFMKARFGADYSDNFVIDCYPNDASLKEISRLALIENQFSSWDGSHRNLERAIKSNMHDPKSYEHVETRYEDKGSYIIVKTAIRGKNAFGAKILTGYTAKIDLEGNVLDLKEME